MAKIKDELAQAAYQGIPRDYFFDKQPPKLFIESLKSPIHTAPPPVWNVRQSREGEVNADYCYIDRTSFPDPEHLLDTAYGDFEAFADTHNIEGGKYPIRPVYRETNCFEEYTVSVTPEECIIYAADTEGIRRGIYWIEDEMHRRSGPFLPLGDMFKHPYIRSRITRCFFSPINRPPKNEDELENDIDYYPDEYLNRLAHDGMNGVWIYTKFCDLLPSSIISEYGHDSERRINKLNKVADKCRRYGIKPYVFAIEPAELTTNELRAKYPELLGASTYTGRNTFCTNTKLGAAYCEEATRTLFTRCPNIGGLIIITMGERGTACGSGSMIIDCPNCKDKKIGEVLSQTVAVLQQGLRNCGTKAEFISWTYGHRFWSYEAIRDYVKSAPDDTMLLENFEESGYEEQLGKTRLAIDYWLSYVGPSQMFKAMAEQANESGKHLYAKIQTCNSHELADVPYMPTPGLLWEKYKAMRSYNVEGVLQCWYFGNYPSIMNKAAGELAFVGEFDSKEKFLKYLAGAYWGEDKAETIAKSWSLFESAYKQFPINVMFSYYGPLQDGTVWQLQLKPKNLPLPRTWQTIDPSYGDRIGECMLDGHTIDEVITLISGMLNDWSEGLKSFPEVIGYYPQDEQVYVAKALEIQIKSGLNILNFYKKRDLLGRQSGDCAEILSEMREIVLDEIENSCKLSILCESDNRLGYHSEGEGYKYFPEKLHRRIDLLKELLETEFVEVEDRIKNNIPPLEYYLGIEEGSTSYRLSHDGIENAPWADFDKPGAGFRAAIDDEYLTFEIKDSAKGEYRISPEFRLMWPDSTVSISSDGAVSYSHNVRLYSQLFGEKLEKMVSMWEVKSHECEGSYITVKIKLEDALRGQAVGAMKIRIVTPSGASWIGAHTPIATLGKPDIRPEDYVWLLP